MEDELLRTTDQAEVEAEERPPTYSCSRKRDISQIVVTV
jgi:hypothetical protein